MENENSEIDFDNCQFEYVNNSFLLSALDLHADSDKPLSYEVSLPSRNLCLVSCLYIYTNPAPVGYGSVGPYVGDTVRRSLKYNRKKNPYYTEDGIRINKAYWEKEDGPYPFVEVCGNWHPYEVDLMLKRMIADNREAIGDATSRIIEEMLNRNADVLTKGRQTWCPFTETSVPSEAAFSTLCQILKENGFTEIITIADIGLSSMKMFARESIRTLSCEWVHKTRRVYNKYKGQWQTKHMKRRNVRWVSIRNTENEPDAVFQYMLNVSNSFCSYIKHGERGKLERRAIASPNMIMRIFLYIIENWHLRFCKKLKGATISMGGNEKKLKIQETLTTAMQGSHEHQYTATEDATKFNECISPDGLAFMHDRIFNLSFPDNDTCRLLRQWFLFGNWILSRKQITLGEGPVCLNADKTHYNRPLFHPNNLGRFNANTAEWVSELRHYFTDHNTLMSSSGMLMGMHNAAATTWSCLSIGYRQDPYACLVSSMKSSDDSMTVYSCINNRSLINGIVTEHKARKLLGVNNSMSKTFYFPHIFGEYTSWYIDENFCTQCGTETSSLRPQGENPTNDFYSIAIKAHTSLSDLEINPMGAQAMITEGVENCRRLWRVSVREDDNLNPGVRFLADGGKIPWSCALSSIPEIVIRISSATNESDRSYLRKACNPENPFIEDSKEEYSYDKSSGTMVLKECEEPLTVFQFSMRKNRTFRGAKQEAAKNDRTHASQAVNILNQADPSLSLLNPLSCTSCSDHVSKILQSNLEKLKDRLSCEGQQQVLEAICRIEGIDLPEDDDD